MANNEFEIIVIGAGHAGCEAALASSRMGFSTLLLTMNLDSIAQMSCNPAIGGMAKGQIVREIDALGGEMAKAIDHTGIQFRMLNTKKGPAVWSPRAQADKRMYHQYMKRVVECQRLLHARQETAERILIENGKATGILTKSGLRYKSRAVILCAGTFLNGLIHIGDVSYPAGRQGEFSSEGVSDQLKRAGFEVGRLKTGTPPRVNSRTICYSGLKKQPGDERPLPFSYSTEHIECQQVPCFITYTNSKTHEIIRENLARSPLYSGKIKGIGPRYCPSLEAKVIRFPDKERHQIFLEPEGLDTEEIYINGLSMSLPADVQEEIVHSIEGMEEAEIMRYGYAIEYDFFPPTQLKSTLETKLIENLYFAGQINGTSGYEEAACQGLVAGINASLKLQRKSPFVLKRSEAYTGVLIDDLVTKGTNEPYRMFTSRVEYRLLLRQDNADFRLMEHGYNLGLIKENQYNEMEERKRTVREEIERLKQTKKGNISLSKWLKRPDVSYSTLPQESPLALADDIAEKVEIEVKYEGYIERELSRIEKFRKLENKKIPHGIVYEDIPGIRKEAKEKLAKVQPISIGQASRISGVSPCDLSMLMVYLENNKIINN